MWNGFWKLTVMVSVIGVGLYAAFQAQKGMKFSLATPPTESQELNSPADSESASVAEPGGFTLDEPNSATSATTVQLGESKSTDSEFDSPAAVSVKQALGKKTAKIVPAKQSASVDFRDNADPFDGKSVSVAKAEDDVSSKKNPSRRVQQVSATSEFTEAPTTDSASNDFTDDAAAPNAITVQNEPTETVEAAPAFNDFESDAPPVQSKRAKKNSDKRAGIAAESETDPFFEDSAPAQLPPSDDTATGSVGSEPAKSESPKIEKDETAGEPVKAREPAPLSAPLALPKDEPSDSPNEPISSGLDRETPFLETPPPARSNPDSLNDGPKRRSSPSTRRSDYDRVMPIDEKDMVGDGVAGDPSMRGLQQPRLTIEKVAQQQAVLNQPLIYSIIVKNTGSVDARNVVIEDRIPKGTELKGTSPQAELSGKRLVWNYPVLKPSEEKRISIKVIPTQEGPIGSVARVYFATEVTAEIVVAAPQLEFTVKAPSEVRLNQRFEMVFNLKNVGKVDATNIIVRDLVPEELKNEAGNDIECPIGKLGPNESREIILPVTALRTGTVTNRAVLTADSSVKKTLDSNIDVIGEVLVLTRSGQNRLYVERPVVFTNNIRNEGNKRADTVKISEVVPAGMEFDSASDGGKYDSNLRAVVWTLGPLAPGNDRQVNVKYVPKETGTHASKITATGAAGSTAAVNSSVEVVGKPELQMETLTATGVVTVGERITSKFQLNNNGTASAKNVQLRIRLPEELKLISIKGPKFQQNGDYVIFDAIPELAPHSKAAYELVLEPTEEADAQVGLEISADHLDRPGRRTETIQIARDNLK